MQTRRQTATPRQRLRAWIRPHAATIRDIAAAILLTACAITTHILLTA